MNSNLFEGRNLVIASMHQKEKVIAPHLEKSLGVKCLIPENLNTDHFGTFTGEIEREDDPIITLRKKCEAAMEITGCDLAIASEGSFGQHPALFFCTADDELLMLKDKKNDIEIIAREIASDTNFNGKEVNTEVELLEFAKNAKFPSHALILKNTAHNFSKVEKGINNKEKLLEIFYQFKETNTSVYVETDMRAMHNPSRMQVIEKAVIKLIEKINSLCPNCNYPGFEVTEINPGLPCSDCSMPTKSTLSLIYECKKCLYKKEVFYPKNKLKEDPMYCDYCNP